MPTQNLLRKLHITDAILVAMYPMTWYLYCFLAVLGWALIWSIRRKPVPAILLIALSATTYNIAILIFFSDNLGGYVNFSWPATLIAVVSAWYFVLGRILTPLNWKK